MSRWRTFADLDQLTNRDSEDWLQGVPIPLFTSIIGLGGQNPKIPSLEILAKRKLCEMYNLRHPEQKDYILEMPVDEMLKSLDVDGVPNAFRTAQKVEKRCLFALSNELGQNRLKPVYVADVYASLRWQPNSETLILQVSKTEAFGKAIYCRFEFTKRMIEIGRLTRANNHSLRLNNSHNPEYRASFTFERISIAENSISARGTDDCIVVHVETFDEFIVIEIPFEKIEYCFTQIENNLQPLGIGRFSPFVDKLARLPPVAKMRSVFVLPDGKVVTYVMYIIKFDYEAKLLFFYHPLESNLHLVAHPFTTNYSAVSSFSSVNRTEYTKNSRVEIIYEFHTENSKGLTIGFLPESQLLSYFQYACPSGHIYLSDERPKSRNEKSSLSFYPDYQLYF